MSMGAQAMNSGSIRCVWLFLFLGASLAGFGQELAHYDERVVLNVEGTASFRIIMEFREWSGQQVLIPVAAKGVRGLKAQGIAPAALRLVERGGERFVALDLPPGAAAPGSVRVDYEADEYFKARGRPGPFGTRTLAYRFVNVSFAAIGQFSAVIVLPEGHVFNAVSRFSPEPEKAGMVAPFAIARQDGRIVGRIAVGEVGLGDEVALACTFRAARRSPWLLFALLALAVAYLVFFRDVLKDGKGDTADKTKA